MPYIFYNRVFPYGQGFKLQSICKKGRQNGFSLQSLTRLKTNKKRNFATCKKTPFPNLKPY